MIDCAGLLAKFSDSDGVELLGANYLVDGAEMTVRYRDMLYNVKVYPQPTQAQIDEMNQLFRQQKKILERATDAAME
jgi:hypothetical protein